MRVRCSGGCELMLLLDRFQWKFGVFDPQRHQRLTSHAPSIPLSMSTDEASLGRCPECGKRLPTVWLLVEYEKEDGQTGIWAECPDCEDVVAPE
jgi:hypothetical protein